MPSPREGKCDGAGDLTQELMSASWSERQAPASKGHFWKVQWTLQQPCNQGDNLMMI